MFSWKFDNLRTVLTVVIGIFGYLLYKNFSFLNLVIVIALSIFVKKPKLIAFAFLVALVLIGIQMIFVQKEVHSVYGNFKVKKVLSMGIVVKQGENNILVKTDKNFNTGDIVFVDGPIFHEHSSFDSYLETNNIKNYSGVATVKLIKKTTDLTSKVYSYLTSGPENFKKIAPLVILGKKTKESAEIYKDAVELSIVHLFVISGFHISLFFMGLSFILTKSKIPTHISVPLALGAVFAYVFLLGFPISATRALLLTSFGVFNKHILKSKFKSLEILAFTMLLMAIWKPWSVSSLSFVFTFMATTVIIYMNSLEIKTPWIKYSLLIFVVYFSTAFISMAINNFLAPFGIFFGVLLTPIFSFMFITSLLLVPFKDFMDKIYFCFLIIIDACKDTNILIDVPNYSYVISKLIYISMLGCFIIIDIWSLSTVKKII